MSQRSGRKRDAAQVDVDAPPAPKRAHSEGHPTGVITFGVVDATGTREIVALNRDVVAGIPYLETMVTTALGTHSEELPYEVPATLFRRRCFWP